MSNSAQMELVRRLSSHPVALALVAMDATDEQLAMAEFKNTNGWPFSLWTLRLPLETPPCAFQLMKAYCCLKYLDTDPPYSPDRDAAYACLSELTIEADRRRAEADRLALSAHRTAQSKRAKKPRDRLDGGFDTLSDMIERLIRLHPDEHPNEIWPHFISALDDGGLDPEEKMSESGPQVHFGQRRKSGRRKTLTLRVFGTRIRKMRNAK